MISRRTTAVGGCALAVMVAVFFGAPAAEAGEQDVLRYREREYEKLQYIVSQGGTYNQTHVVGDKSFMRDGYLGQTVTLDKVVKPEQVMEPQALVLETDRDALDVVLRRTEALLNHLKVLPGAPDLSEHEASLANLKNENSSVAVSDAARRQELYHQACDVRRSIALANPLLDFKDLLFVEFCYLKGTHLHICSQFHASQNQYTGGRLCVLEDALGPEPRRRDLLENAVVENGPQQGKKLEGGMFLSPELSWDGSTVYFAWSAKSEGGWTEGNSFHVFRVNSDGTGLRQLTFGPTDDFDPCVLPNGRVAFLSTRRGLPYFMYLRCGGDRPSYTLYSMKPDGSDIYPLSYHETHEWNPSVDNEGRIVYSRWDYVDRASDIAHHIWYCNPDGTDPRAPHGNYPHPYVDNWVAGDHYTPPVIDGHKLGGLRGAKGASPLRPNAELNIRAIPESHKYIATAVGHHGVACGSLIMIDTRVKDDGMMSQVKRVTPNCLFPETEDSYGAEKDVDLWGRPYPQDLPYTHPQYYRTAAYATAWPFSEDFYICNHWKSIILLDRFGNRIPLHTLSWDEKEWNETGNFRPIDPMPFQARPVPKVVADRTTEGEDRDTIKAKAAISVQNIYEMSPFPWPEGVKEQKKIKWMRIVQVFPWIYSYGINAGGFSMATARMSLGIVPVEEDGSVFCEAPIHKPIYFQALDENQMAIQSMKSVTYVHKGEQLSCLGCHEDKWKAIPPMTSTPIALQREPSELTAEFPGHLTDPNKGAVPFNYFLLAQPVLAELGYPTDYATIKKRGWHPKASSFSMPGRVGAHESDLGKELLEKYKNGEITDEQFHRLVMWLDIATMRLGWYNDTSQAKAGEVVWPEVDMVPGNPLGIQDGTVGVREAALEDLRRRGRLTEPSVGETPAHRISIRVSGNYVHVENPFGGPLEYYIHDLRGRSVEGMRGRTDGRTLRADISNLPTGMYRIALRSKRVHYSATFLRTR